MECENCRLTNHTTSDCIVTDEDIITLEKCRAKILLKQNKIDNNKNKLFGGFANNEINDKIKKFEDKKLEIIKKYDEVYAQRNKKQNNSINVNTYVQDASTILKQITEPIVDTVKEVVEDIKEHKNTTELSFKCKYCEKSFTTQNGANYHQFKYCKNKPTTYKKQSIPSLVK